jgi:hypothetical protein
MIINEFRYRDLPKIPEELSDLLNIEIDIYNKYWK